MSESRSGYYYIEPPATTDWGFRIDPKEPNSGAVSASVASQLGAVKPEAGQAWYVDLANLAPGRSVLERLEQFSDEVVEVTRVTFDAVVDWTNVDEIPDATADMWHKSRMRIEGVYKGAADAVGSVNEALGGVRSALIEAGNPFWPTGYGQQLADLGDAVRNPGGWLSELQGAARWVAILLIVLLAWWIVTKVA